MIPSSLPFVSSTDKRSREEESLLPTSSKQARKSPSKELESNFYYASNDPPTTKTQSFIESIGLGQSLTFNAETETNSHYLLTNLNESLNLTEKVSQKKADQKNTTEVAVDTQFQKVYSSHTQKNTLNNLTYVSQSTAAQIPTVQNSFNKIAHSLLRKVRFDVAAGRYQEALEDLSTLSNIRGVTRELHVRAAAEKAFIYNNIDLYSRALEELNQISHLNGVLDETKAWFVLQKSFALNQLKQAQQAINVMDFLEASANISYGLRLGLFIQLANAFNILGKYSLTLNTLKDISLNGLQAETKAWLILQRLIAYNQLGMFTETTTEAQSLTEDLPQVLPHTQAKILCHLAHAQIKLREFEKALMNLENISKPGVVSLDAYLWCICQQAECYTRLGQVDRALATLSAEESRTDLSIYEKIDVLLKKAQIFNYLEQAQKALDCIQRIETAEFLSDCRKALIAKQKAQAHNILGNQHLVFQIYAEARALSNIPKELQDDLHLEYLKACIHLDRYEELISISNHLFDIGAFETKSSLKDLVRFMQALAHNQLGQHQQAFDLLCNLEESNMSQNMRQMVEEQKNIAKAHLNAHGLQIEKKQTE